MPNSLEDSLKEANTSGLCCAFGAEAHRRRLAHQNQEAHFLIQVSRVIEGSKQELVRRARSLEQTAMQYLMSGVLGIFLAAGLYVGLSRTLSAPVTVVDLVSVYTPSAMIAALSTFFFGLCIKTLADVRRCWSEIGRMHQTAITLMGGFAIQDHETKKSALQHSLQGGSAEEGQSIDKETSQLNRLASRVVGLISIPRRIAKDSQQEAKAGREG